MGAAQGRRTSAGRQARRHRHRADRLDRAARAAPAHPWSTGAGPRGSPSRGAAHGRRRTPTVVTPTIPFGMCEHHMSLNGTITLDYATMDAVLRCVVQFHLARTASSASSCSTAMAATPTAMQNFISEFTIKHSVPFATGTYWNIAAGGDRRTSSRSKRYFCTPARPRPR